MRAGRAGTGPGLGYQVLYQGGTDVPEELKLRLLERVASSFRERAFLERVEVLPSSYLTSHGSFEELDSLAAMLGFTEVVLVSYDQHQFSASGTSSWTYWTIVGAAVVEGEKNETKTVLDAVVFDLPSRSFLLRAAGQSSIKGESLLLAVDKKLDAASKQGFELAVDDLAANLDRALSEFELQAAKGTVRGPGTPEVAVFDSASGRPVAVRADGGGFDWGGAIERAAELELRAAQEGPVDEDRITREYRTLATLFRVKLSSFGRKRYENLSHEPNKPMNLNSYIGLIGQSLREVSRNGRLQPRKD